MLSVFEVTLINQEVVDAVQSGVSHRDLDDGWAENRFLEIKARDMDDAWAKMKSKYPEKKGYVIKSIHQMDMD
jgi:hypothetical protein